MDAETVQFGYKEAADEPWGINEQNESVLSLVQQPGLWEAFSVPELRKVGLVDVQ